MGGDPPKNGRARAFYRNGDNPQAVSLNDQKGAWFDNRDQVGGGMLDLVQRVLGCDRGPALRWIAEFTGLSLDNRAFTLRERREYAQRSARAKQLAREASDFERGLELSLERRQKNAGAVIPWLLSLGLDDVCELFGGAASGLAILRKADADCLVAFYSGLPEAVRRPFRDAGRHDREHAEAVTGAIVKMLASARQDREASA